MKRAICPLAILYKYAVLIATGLSEAIDEEGCGAVFAAVNFYKQEEQS
jgi:hypothetical protein